jgi:hypothetical protein
MRLPEDVQISRNGSGNDSLSNGNSAKKISSSNLPIDLVRTELVQAIRENDTLIGKVPNFVKHDGSKIKKPILFKILKVLLRG